MVIVDSSVWIDYFLGKENLLTNKVDLLLIEEDVVLLDLIFIEVLQGFKFDRDFKIARELLQKQILLNRNNTDHISSIINYRLLRKKGITIRKTVDCIIASYCIDHNIPLLFSDKDFEPFVSHLGLQTP